MSEFQKKYEPKDFEQRIYSAQEKAGKFKPSNAKKTYYIPMPPPNVTGKLHRWTTLHD